MKILIVDHFYHQKTKSADLLEAFIPDNSIVQTFYIDPSSSIDLYISDLIKLVEETWDVVLLWQIDYLGAFFSSYGHKVIIFPMFDGSFSLPSSHWRALKDCTIISFSLKLHAKIARFCQSSFFFQYYPLPQPLELRHLGSHDSAFFWIREPKSLVSLANVIKVIPSFVNKIHLHCEPEDLAFVKSESEQYLSRFAFSFSTWFKNKQQYIEKVLESTFYIAPRESEGIGFGFLEAMSLNRIVIANDESTHNEYIDNYCTGILCNFRDPVSLAPISLSSSEIDCMQSLLDRQHSSKLMSWKFSISSIQDIISSRANDSVKHSEIAGNPESLKGLMMCHINSDLYAQTLSAILGEGCSNATTNRHVSLRRASCLVSKKQFDDAIGILRGLTSEDQNWSYIDSKIQFIEQLAKKYKSK